MSGAKGLRAAAERGIPASLPAGSLTSAFVFGSCFHDEQSLAGLEILVAGEATPAMAHSMPRIDIYNANHHETDVWSSPSPHPPVGSRNSYRSGFWGTVPLRMPASGGVEVEVRATLADGTTETAAIGRIEAAASEGAAVLPSQPRVAICMATYNPDPALFAAQIDSIRDQTTTDWVCLISDDGSDPEHLEAIGREIEGDPRFILSAPGQNVGFYRNFERCLRMVPASVELVALSDQDDVWNRDKLERLERGLGGASLVYSDQRLVDEAGGVISSTFWGGERTNNYRNLISLLIANTVTGAASLMRRELLDDALPFPITPGTQYHDHWLALVAAATGGIAYVDEPLYDYVQHGGAMIGHEGSNSGAVAQPRGAGIRGSLKAAGAGSRFSYFFAYVRLRVLAETLLLRVGDRMRPQRRRSLKLFANAESSPLAAFWLLARRLRAKFGHRETLDAERIVLLGLFWRRAVVVLGRLRSRPIPSVTYDASLPATAERTESSGLAEIDHKLTHALAALIEPIELVGDESEPLRVNLMIPTVELRHLFGGYIAKFNLARALAAKGHRVRILTVDPTPMLPPTWKQEVESYAGLGGLFDDVEIAFARDVDAPVKVNPRDAFIATTWWTAYAADNALRQLDRTGFLYLIQEFEPFTHPLGSWSAFAMSTYSMPHTALFSTDFLQRYFSARGYGVYANGQERGDAESMPFQNAITEVTAPSAAELEAREGRRLLFYARPEPHGSRNMFEVGLLALRKAVADGTFDETWTLSGIGSVEGADRRLALGGGRELELLAKRGQGDYGQLLAGHDIGLSLMYTPHPSLVPIEMASAGLVTVTNSYETKTAEELARISPNLLTVEASVDRIAEGLREAVVRAEDFEARRLGSAVDWSSDWGTSFGPDVIDRVDELLSWG